MSDRRNKEILLLAVDVGNTSSTFGLFKSGALMCHWNGSDAVIPKIDRFLIKKGLKRKVDKVIICSVNPNNELKVVRRLASIVNKKNIRKVSVNSLNFANFGSSSRVPFSEGDVAITGLRLLRPFRARNDRRLRTILTKKCAAQIDNLVKFKHKYRNINKLGKDRLVDIYGAFRRKKLPVLIINFGTATTFDYISKRGVYEGGLIIPGIETSLNALQEKAALLPSLKLGRLPKSKGLIGRETKACMTLGLLQGFGAMADGLIGRFKQQYGPKLNVLACGGLARLIAPYVKSRMRVDRGHTLKSLAQIEKDCR